jgi:phosphatidylinositol-3-phosphatase
MKNHPRPNRPHALVARGPRFAASATLLGAATAAVAVLAPARSAMADDDSKIRTVFVIAMENHNFTQTHPTSSPQQILGNPAAPYINSLVTPGNPNAAQVSYATKYYNAGVGVHPSEPNYVWAEAGTDFGVHTDADPRAANGNIFASDHLTAQLNVAGISWKNYQEDVQLSGDPLTSASGTNGPVNPYNGSTQFNYAVKHNPMAFFPDTGTQNVYPLAQFFEDLSCGNVGQYNWITPDQYNDQHSALTGGFTYQGTSYTGDQSSIAQGDNFLSIVVPQIMASKAYKHNGVIVIWWDESEQGDTVSETLGEIVISHLAKGNAYASSVELNHSSDLKTMEEVFDLPFLNNAIPTSETNVEGTGYNTVASVNDLSDLFVAKALKKKDDNGDD